MHQCPHRPRERDGRCQEFGDLPEYSKEVDATLHDLKDLDQALHGLTGRFGLHRVCDHFGPHRRKMLAHECAKITLEHFHDLFLIQDSPEMKKPPSGD
ncbi:hypothetical protein [Pandoraea terrigena]|uniref:hypothetical protein n=1 Tax=Pandoraea terrigena TaxID=2508292 RepID=UPI0012405D7C|nr:hypothetical protein [Pandoraea terrigena]